jgi:hypothetical protein
MEELKIWKKIGKRYCASSGCACAEHTFEQDRFRAGPFPVTWLTSLPVASGKACPVVRSSSILRTLIWYSKMILLTLQGTWSSQLRVSYCIPIYFLWQIFSTFDLLLLRRVWKYIRGESYLFSPWHRPKIFHLTLSKNHSITP